VIPVNERLSSPARRYGAAVTDLVSTALREEEPQLAAAAAVVSQTWGADGLLYIFGSGHSHMFAEEAFYRAGGAARICPILQPPHMLHEGAVRSTQLERQSGHAQNILAAYEIHPARDCIIVVSNSGANALPVEVASLSRESGIPVIAITSREYASAVTRPGPRLHDVADIVVDNHCPPGDALVRLNNDADLPPMGPGSTIVGLTLLNTVVVEACALGLEAGRPPDLFLSANMPGASAHNEALTAELSARIPHL
jgi:uncharacterized phosphosugar-binding protein